MAEPSSWERRVLEAEISRSDTIGWYRNLKGGERAIRVPYVIEGIEKPLYPDFVFVHETADGVKASLVDPHNYAFADTIHKWQGLAQYAKKHEADFHRVDAVIEAPDGELLALDLKNTKVQEEIRKIKSADGMLNLFSQRGGKYIP